MKMNLLVKGARGFDWTPEPPLNPPLYLIYKKSFYLMVIYPDIPASSAVSYNQTIS